MRAILLKEAEIEFWESIAYYEEREPGFGLRFKDEVGAFVNKIEKNPLIPRLRPKGYRRVNLSVFPYSISYIVRGDIIWIVTIAHSHRKPEFWIDRIKNR